MFGEVSLVRGRSGFKAPIDLVVFDVLHSAREQLQQLRHFHGRATAKGVAQ
jgi:hypothetical protein